MISKRRQQHYFREQWGNIMHHFDRFAKRTDAEHIHQLRVNLKKLRALEFLQDEVHGNIAKKLHRPVRKLFRQAGKIRDAQVSAHLLRESGIRSARFFTQQKQIVAKEAKKLVRLVDDIGNQLVARNLETWKRIQPISDRQYGKVLRRLEKKITYWFVPRLRVKDLHDSRKEIKRLVYLHELLPGRIRDKINVNTAQYKKLEDSIGKWHDSIYAAELIQKNLPREPAVQRRLRRTASSSLKKIRQEFHKAVRRN